MFDELDSLVPNRDKVQHELEQRLVSMFLTLMDGLKKNEGVVVIGTTNRINAIDPALRRGGRFELEIHISVPDFSGRKEIMEIYQNKMRLSEDVDFSSIFYTLESI